MNILCTICARGGSKGVPNKNIKLLNGLPLIAHTIEQAIETRLFDHIVVSTDSKEIAEVAVNSGAECWFLRPKILSTDKASKLDAIRHAVNEAETRFNQCYDLVVDLDATSPLRKVSDIQDSLDYFLKSKASNLITASPARKNPYFNMVEKKGKSYGIVIDSNNSVQNRQEAKQVYSLSSSIFCFNYMLLFKISHWSEGEIDIYLISRKRGFDLDTMDDYEYFKTTTNE